MYRNICKSANIGWKEVTLTVVLKIGVISAALLSAQLIGRVLGAIQEEESISAGELILLVVAVLGELFFTLANTRFFGLQTQKATNNLCERANVTITGANYQLLTQISDGDLYQRATEDSKRTANFLYQSSVGLLSSGLTFGVGLVYLALVKWYLAPIYGAMWLCIFALQFWLSKSADTAMSEVFAKNAEIGEQFRGLYSRIGLIRSYNYETQAQKKLEDGTKGYVAATRNVWAKRSLLTLPMSILAFLPVFVMFVISSYLTGVGQITVAELVSVTVLLVTVDSGMSQMPTLFLDWRSNRASAKRYLELVLLPLETLSDTPEKPGRTGEISLQNVSLSYGDQPVLRNVSLKIQSGEKVAVVGRSGSGKSTLIKLMAGLLVPDEGEVTVSGKRPDTELEVRQELSCAFQQGGPLFQRSVAENVSYGRENATPAQLQKAFRSAVVDFVSDETGNRKASELSGGQQRRVEIARALLKGGEIFLFDEITSELDTDTTNRLLAGLAEETVGKTVVFVSHDWAEIQQAERILVVDQGQIVQDGKTEALLQSEGLFRTLFLSEVTHHE
ncbi:hypothetical protein DPQ25_05205 [Hydrogeniiclostridium mannosilyticum]|uniref:ABC transporter ATP-binding protein n=1 Tax=Hydrogeniiclostridium mannosilyticum TaxID=2764322 RepID=A0A328UDM2_9FIRM|nr:ABC transporter ATP-binding protein [Hydrogeniiclostridium mannosilyticum]RAQ29696.1 hypothetical protein DPQ25_05205 [Hydrogeniiclostridium mannosilyticum]